MSGKSTTSLREIKTCSAHCIMLSAPQNGDISAWVLGVVKEYPSLELEWLLAHADDGVIWGRVENGSLLLSSGVTPHSPALRTVTLRMLRLFSHAGEVLLWRDDDGVLRARLVSESVLPDGAEVLETWEEYFDETQLLWGSEVESTSAGFSCLREGRQGMRHAPPVPLPQGSLEEPLRLEVRQYLAREEFARIAAGRLLSLRNVTAAEIAADSEPILDENDGFIENLLTA